MNLALKHIITKGLIALIAIQIINLSVDAVDFQPTTNIVYIGDFNYFNSLTEYIAETVLGNKDAFPEFQKESSSSKSQIVKHFSLKIFSATIAIATPAFVQTSNSFIVPLTEQYSYLYMNEINPPPPKA